MNSFQTAERTAVLLALLAAALVFSIGSAMSQTETIWSEDFTGETGSTTSGDQWTAITPANVIAAVSDDEKFKVNGNNSGSGGTCIWTSEPIGVSGYTDIQITWTYATGNGWDGVPPVLSMTNGTLSGSAFTPDAGASTTVITFSVTVPKQDGKWEAIDDIILTGICSFDQQTWYEDADGDGLGDPAVSQDACAQPEGFVLDNSDPEPDLNPDDYHGTPLYPGDVYMSYAAEEFSTYGISESYVGFTQPNFGSQSAGWSYLWDASTELLPGSGYMAMLPQNQDALISVTGPFAIGDVNIDLTFTDDPNQSNETVDGWNLVSNPYPSPVNLEQVLSRVDGVEAYWIYDNSGDGAYITRWRCSVNA
jgi:hypothetical protein